MRSRTALVERSSTFDGGGVTLAGGGVERSARLGEGAAVWAFAGAEVLRWGVKTRSGFSVADGRVVAVGNRYWIVARLGPLRIHEPVQVVAVVDEVDQKGFAYSTLDGHPIRGEEAFVVERRTDDSVWLTIRSLTYPARGLRRAGYPRARLAQPFYRRRYLRALAETVG
ncbi:DUF1990 domain-containing protein [Kribbella antibiotica]|uniref:DUF1990 domain-containing protein n=1 Tax=Kribbella antibiotica TaxID=190195 RepID=A0A4V2YM97_9ACTN|nr:DUF1990 family protein [Kribbella antibiotica]TDD49767.1 DUF1990 domain-containing protein [Kribbella antibiotica]